MMDMNMQRSDGVGGEFFLERYDNKIVTKRGEKNTLSRSEWTIIANIKQRYDIIYNEMVDTGLAIKNSVP